MKTWINTSAYPISIGDETFQPGEWHDKEDTFCVNRVEIQESYLYLARLVHEVKAELPLTVDETGELDEKSKALLAQKLIEKGIDRVAVAVAAKQEVDGKLRTVTEKYVTELVASYKE